MENLQTSIDYFKNEFNLELDTNTVSSTKEFVVQVLQNTRNLNRPSLDIAIAKQKIKDRIKDIETSMVTGDSYDGVSGGYNNGKRDNIIEKKHLKKLELEEKLTFLINSSFELDNKLDTINNHVISLINNCCCAYPETIETLLCYYIHCKSIEFIAYNTNSCIETINTRKRRGIEYITKKIRKL